MLVMTRRSSCSLVRQRSVMLVHGPSLAAGPLQICFSLEVCVVSLLVALLGYILRRAGILTYVVVIVPLPFTELPMNEMRWV